MPEQPDVRIRLAFAAIHQLSELLVHQFALQPKQTKVGKMLDSLAPTSSWQRQTAIAIGTRELSVPNVIKIVHHPLTRRQEEMVSTS